MFTTKAIYFANKIVSAPDTTYHYVEFSNSTVKSKENSLKKRDDHLNTYTALQVFAQKRKIKLPERLNYTKSHWKGPLKIYEGKFKTKILLFGILPTLIRTK